MYYRKFCWLLLLVWGCAESDIRVTVELLDPGPLARQLISRDPFEGYFERVERADVQLQIHPLTFDSLRFTEQYQNWLAEQLLPWPTIERDRWETELRRATRAVEEKLPGLLPDNIYLCLTRNEPYGAHVYFTRQNAIFAPLAEVQNATITELRRVLYHELFHILSRYNPALRPRLYTLANYGPAPAEIRTDSFPELVRLTNPDEPPEPYWLLTPTDTFYTLLYARPGSQDFSPALDFLTSEVAISTPSSPPVLTQNRISATRLATLTGANTGYLIHPEEIMAEHFALLFVGNTAELNFPDNIQKLEAQLKLYGQRK